MIQVASELMKLADISGEDMKHNIEDRLIADLIEILDMNKLARYKQRKNLIGEPLNKQISQDS